MCVNLRKWIQKYQQKINRVETQKLNPKINKLLGAEKYDNTKT